MSANPQSGVPRAVTPAVSAQGTLPSYASGCPGTRPTVFQDTLRRWDAAVRGDLRPTQARGGAR